jgi:hypothetical protein
MSRNRWPSPTPMTSRQGPAPRRQTVRRDATKQSAESEKSPTKTDKRLSTTFSWSQKVHFEPKSVFEELAIP